MSHQAKRSEVKWSKVKQSKAKQSIFDELHPLHSNSSTALTILYKKPLTEKKMKKMNNLPEKIITQFQSIESFNRKIENEIWHWDIPCLKVGF